MSEKTDRKALVMEKIESIGQVDSTVLSLFSWHYAYHYCVMPLALSEEGTNKQLRIAIRAPLDLAVLDTLQWALGGIEIVPVLAPESEIKRAIEQYYGPREKWHRIVCPDA